MPTSESPADLDIQVRAHVLANAALYEQAGRDIDTTYSPEAFWQDDLAFYKAQPSYPVEDYPTLDQWQSAAKRAPLIVSRLLEHHRYDRGIPPADEAAIVVLLHWVLTDQACNSAPVKLTAFQDWSIASVDHDLMRAYAYGISDNAEWREYVRKALAVMQSQLADAASSGPAKPRALRKRRATAIEAKPLTDRERQAVQLADEGHGPTAIGKRMGVTKSYAATLRDKGREKLKSLQLAVRASGNSARPKSSIADVQFKTDDD